MTRLPCKPAVLLCAIAAAAVAPRADAARIGVDDIHGSMADSIMGSGQNFDEFRAALAEEGHALVPLTSFGPAALAGLDGLIIRTPFGFRYTPDEQAAIRQFTQRAVFISDTSLFADTPPPPYSDTPLAFADNRRLLHNVLEYITAGGGTAFLADNAPAADIANFNQLVAPYGVQFAASFADPDGRSVSDFVDHPLTAGIGSVGVDTQLPMAIAFPSFDLTIGDGNDNILAAFEVPEPSVTILLAVALTLPRRRRPLHSVRRVESCIRGLCRVRIAGDRAS